MDRSKSKSILNPDIFDVLSAAWVMACNDENPIMSYIGIRHRLCLPDSFDLHSLIRSRGDLFRLGVPEHRLEKWKNDMLKGHHRPSWIRELQNEELCIIAIKNLSRSDVFRSQFRTKEDDPRSSIQTIDWGLQHIDRIRKASLEADDKTAKSWQIWIVFITSILGVVATIVAAVLKK